MTLAARLRARIAESGPITIEEFMAAALSDPRDGYYRRGGRIGRGGDFVTAPEISQVFGELIGLWCAQVWMQAGSPNPVHIVELGPGRGTLMADALRAIAKAAPAFSAALRVHLVEINPAFRADQARALTSHAPTWHDDLATAPAGAMLLIANEFFDALPVRQHVRVGGQWRERRVGVADGRFVAVAGDGASIDAAHARDAIEGAIIETAPARDGLMHAIAARIARDGIGALIVDYGTQAPGLGDTLQAIQAGRMADPLADPGEADLTAHVDFAALAAAATKAGARAHGPMPQGVFLNRLGIAARLAVLSRAAPGAARALVKAGERLIDPAQMGSLFKALAIMPASSPPPPGFS